MELPSQIIHGIDRFTTECNFMNGGLVLDLDGTALLEQEGKVFISSAVEEGVKAVHTLGRPVVLNTLRFPLSVLSTVGEGWYQITNVPILTVLLNGALTGYIVRNNGKLEYEELSAHPLNLQEIEKILEGVEELVEAGITDLLLFYYSRDWREGETLWTPQSGRVESLKQRYTSAQRVFAGNLSVLKAELLHREICMTCLFVDRPEDTLMAYQHSKRNSFFTAPGVDKASGLIRVAERIGFSVKDSMGAGDTIMDSFLAEVGLAVIVGRANLPYSGTHSTIRVESPQQLGQLIAGLTERANKRFELEKTKTH